MFHRDFMDYHQDRFEDFSLMVFEADKLLAVLPANRVDDVVFSHQGLTYGGLVFKSDLKLNKVTVCLKAILEYLKSNDIKTLHIKELPSIYCKLPNDELNYLAFKLQAQLTRRDTLSVVDMLHRPKFSKDRVDGYKRGKKQGLQVKEENNFEEFWNQILIPNLSEKHDALPVHSLEEIMLLKTRFPKNIRQFNVYYQGKIVAGTTIFETNQVAHSQYISGNSDKNQLGSLDFLHMHLLEEVFASKRYFDFGISNENQGQNINQGLQYWKEGFGARTVTQDFYSIPVENLSNLDAIFI
ncbi:MAG TPA: GNAT family N-acetyltransferase [Flavobacteriaceae bacterium]|nr:GNAT family N-acetyltransferase [Flavobacteriaceae bacterium]